MVVSMDENDSKQHGRTVPWRDELLALYTLSSWYEDPETSVVKRSDPRTSTKNNGKSPGNIPRKGTTSLLSINSPHAIKEFKIEWIFNRLDELTDALPFSGKELAAARCAIPHCSFAFLLKHTHIWYFEVQTFFVVRSTLDRFCSISDPFKRCTRTVIRRYN